MSRGLPVASPPVAFQQSRILWGVFVIAVLLYFVTGEIISARVEDFKSGGLVDPDSGMLWVIRLILIAESVVSLVILQAMFSTDQMMARLVAKSSEVTDELLTQALSTRQILSLAFIEAIAIYGLALFIMNGHRYDLYGFGVVALLMLMLLRPTREKWEATFRQASLEYPGVSSSPW